MNFHERLRRAPRRLNQLVRGAPALPPRPAQTRPYRFVFVVGAEGSGTTMLTRILSAPAGAVGLGGNFTTIPETDGPAHAVMLAFSRANAALWDRHAGHGAHASAGTTMRDLIDRLLGLETYRAVTHVVYKRSAPFFAGDRYRPDLADLPALFPDLRIIVAYRDPRASAYSALHRGFGANVRQCAVICEEQLTYLAAQLATLPRDLYRIVRYEPFCAAPAAEVSALAAFCGLPAPDLHAALAREGVEAGRSARWRGALGPGEQTFLNEFFDARRLAQWALLDAAEG